MKSLLFIASRRLTRDFRKNSENTSRNTSWLNCYRFLHCTIGKGRYDGSGKLKLYGFNNLTKALSFNIYDVCYAKTPREQKDYIAYIDEQYNSDRPTGILTTLTDMIGATVL